MAAVTAATAKLAAGDFSGLRDLAIPDLAWVQPGVNRMSGAHAGKVFTRFAQQVRRRATRRASPRSARRRSIAASR